MNNKQAEKTTPALTGSDSSLPKPGVASKSFMAFGPTLHYSHENVLRCWLLAFVTFSVSCLFWSKMLTGAFWSINLHNPTSSEFWRLGQSIITGASRGVSIFEYPWQILVLGLLMGIIAVVPVMVSQLMSFSYSFPFILAVFFLADMPGFAVCILVSCVAAACRPLRFRSRIIAVALCTAPQLLYWGYFGGAWKLEPMKLGFSFAPWICAWLIGLSIAALVLGIGHYTRYRPGLVWVFTLVFLLLAIVTFEIRIGFDELDYQLYVAKNNPEQAIEFHEHSITEAFDNTLEDPDVKKYLASSFYSTDPILLRAELKVEIHTQLSYGHWPYWFIVPPELDFRAKKLKLFAEYESFISRRSQSPRMPIALYYKALLSEYRPVYNILDQKEKLRFYNDYPHRDSLPIWHHLYEQFPDSSESLEARWRIAKDLAGRVKFGQADKLLKGAQGKLVEKLKLFEKDQPPGDTFFSPFRPVADSAMTAFKLTELQSKLNLLRNLIGPENRVGGADTETRLARFVMLNPHSADADFLWHLDELLKQMGDKDPLRDNILLAKAKLVADEQLRAEQLAQLHRDFQGTDGGMQALYELGLLKRRQWSQQNESNVELKKKFLVETRAILTSFISLYPGGIFTEQVQKILDDLPVVD
jgi:hypothetical protein